MSRTAPHLVRIWPIILMTGIYLFITHSIDNSRDTTEWWAIWIWLLYVLFGFLWFRYQSIRYCNPYNHWMERPNAVQMRMNQFLTECVIHCHKFMAFWTDICFIWWSYSVWHYSVLRFSWPLTQILILIFYISIYLSIKSGLKYKCVSLRDRIRELKLKQVVTHW